MKLLLVFATLMLAHMSNAWVRFREPLSRRNFLNQSLIEKLQNCAGKEEEGCGLCGEGPGEIQTNLIPTENYTVIDPDVRVLAVELGFRSGLNGHLEFRVCNVTDNSTADGIACNYTTPLLIGSDVKWYPASTQSSAKSRFRLPRGLVCERCVLQVKYTPGPNSTMKDFRFFDCSLLNITHPTKPVEEPIAITRETGSRSVFPPDHSILTGSHVLTETRSGSSMRGSDISRLINRTTTFIQTDQSGDRDSFESRTIRQNGSNIIVRRLPSGERTASIQIGRVQSSRETVIEPIRNPLNERRDNRKVVISTNIVELAGNNQNVGDSNVDRKARITMIDIQGNNMAGANAAGIVVNSASNTENVARQEGGTATRTEFVNTISRTEAAHRERSGIDNTQTDILNTFDGISANVDNTRKEVTGITANVDNTRKEVTGITANVDNTRKEVTGIIANVDNTRKEVIGITSNVDNTRKEVVNSRTINTNSGTNTNLDRARSEIINTRTVNAIAGSNANIGGIRSELTNTRTLTTNVDGDVNIGRTRNEFISTRNMKPNINRKLDNIQTEFINTQNIGTQTNRHMVDSVNTGVVNSANVVSISVTSSGQTAPNNVMKEKTNATNNGVNQGGQTGTTSNNSSAYYEDSYYFYNDTGTLNDTYYYNEYSNQSFVSTAEVPANTPVNNAGESGGAVLARTETLKVNATANGNQGSREDRRVVGSDLASGKMTIATRTMTSRGSSGTEGVDAGISRQANNLNLSVSNKTTIINETMRLIDDLNIRTSGNGSEMGDIVTTQGDKMDQQIVSVPHTIIVLPKYGLTDHSVVQTDTGYISDADAKTQMDQLSGNDMTQTEITGNTINEQSAFTEVMNQTRQAGEVNGVGAIIKETIRDSSTTLTGVRDTTSDNVISVENRITLNKLNSVNIQNTMDTVNNWESVGTFTDAGPGISLEGTAVYNDYDSSTPREVLQSRKASYAISAANRRPNYVRNEIIVNEVSNQNDVQTDNLNTITGSRTAGIKTNVNWIITNTNKTVQARNDNTAENDFNIGREHVDVSIAHFNENIAPPTILKPSGMETTKQREFARGDTGVKTNTSNFGTVDVARTQSDINKIRNQDRTVISTNTKTTGTFDQDQPAIADNNIIVSGSISSEVIRSNQGRNTEFSASNTRNDALLIKDSSRNVNDKSLVDGSLTDTVVNERNSLSNQSFNRFSSLVPSSKSIFPTSLPPIPIPDLNPADFASSNINQNTVIEKTNINTVSRNNFNTWGTRNTNLGVSNELFDRQTTTGMNQAIVKGTASAPTTQDAASPFESTRAVDVATRSYDRYLGIRSTSVPPLETDRSTFVRMVNYSTVTANAVVQVPDQGVTNATILGTGRNDQSLEAMFLSTPGPGIPTTTSFPPIAEVAVSIDPGSNVQNRQEFSDINFIDTVDISVDGYGGVPIQRSQDNVNNGGSQFVSGSNKNTVSFMNDHLQRNRADSRTVARSNFDITNQMGEGVVFINDRNSKEVIWKAPFNGFAIPVGNLSIDPRLQVNVTDTRSSLITEHSNDMRKDESNTTAYVEHFINNARNEPNDLKIGKTIIWQSMTVDNLSEGPNKGDLNVDLATTREVNANGLVTKDINVNILSTKETKTTKFNTNNIVNAQTMKTKDTNAELIVETDRKAQITDIALPANGEKVSGILDISVNGNAAVNNVQVNKEDSKVSINREVKVPDIMPPIVIRNLVPEIKFKYQSEAMDTQSNGISGTVTTSRNDRNNFVFFTPYLSNADSNRVDVQRLKNEISSGSIKTVGTNSLDSDVPRSGVIWSNFGRNVGGRLPSNTGDLVKDNTDAHNLSVSSMWDINRGNTDQASGAKFASSTATQLNGVQGRGTVYTVRNSSSAVGVNGVQVQDGRASKGNVNEQVLRTLEALVLELEVMENKPRRTRRPIVDSSAYREVQDVNIRHTVNPSSHTLFRVDPELLQVRRDHMIGRFGPDMLTGNQRSAGNHRILEMLATANRRHWNSDINFPSLSDSGKSMDTINTNRLIQQYDETHAVPKDVFVEQNNLNIVSNREGSESRGLLNMLGIEKQRHWNSDINVNTMIDSGNSTNNLNASSSAQQVIGSLKVNQGVSDRFKGLLNAFADSSINTKIRSPTTTELAENIQSVNGATVEVVNDSLDSNIAPITQQVDAVIPKIIEGNTVNSDNINKHQTIIRTPTSVLLNPFTGKNITFSRSDKFIARGIGNLKYLTGVEGVYRANLSGEFLNPGYNFTPLTRESGLISIGGKYFPGQMRRNAMGQFEPVPLASDFDATSAENSKQIQPENIVSQGDTALNNKDTQTVSSTSEVLNNMQMDNKINSGQFFGNPKVKNQELITGQKNKVFFSQNELLKSNGIFSDLSLVDGIGINTHSTILNSVLKDNVKCEPNELFVCQGVGNNRHIPGMVWWCFSHCKNGICPPEKCSCHCAPARESPEPETRAIFSNGSNGSKTKRRKKVIELTLNSNENNKKTIDTNSKQISSEIMLPKVLNASVATYNQIVRPKILNATVNNLDKPRDGGAIVNTNIEVSRTNVLNTTDVAYEQVVRPKVLNATVVDTFVTTEHVENRTLKCKGINAFADTPGIGDLCARVCSRNICPESICLCV